MTKLLNIGTKVMVISGKEKGKTAEVIKYDKKNNRVFLKDLNVVTDYNQVQQNGEGGYVKQTVSREQSMDVSNIKIVK